MIDHDASPEDARRAAKSGKKTVLDVPPEAIEKEHKALQQEHGPGDHEANAVKRVAAKMIRQSSAIGGRIIGKENSNLSPQEKERRRKERLERDAWCRRERKYRDSSPDGRGEPTEWFEGDKVRRRNLISFLAVRTANMPLRRSSSSTPTVGRTSATSPRKSDVNRQRSTSPLSTRWDITRKRWKPSSLAWLARSRTAAFAVSDAKGRNPKPPPLTRNGPLRLPLAASRNRQNDKAPLPKRRRRTGTLLPPRSTGRDSRWTGPNASSLCRRMRRKRRLGNRKPRRAELPRRVGARPSGRVALPCKPYEACSALVPTRRVECRQLSPPQTIRPTRIRTATLRSGSRLKPDRTEKARRPVTVGRCQSWAAR